MAKVIYYISTLYLLFQSFTVLFAQIPTWYGYKSQWINLATLEVKDKADFQPNTDFKTHHPFYKSYFAGLSIDKLAYQAHYFEIQPNNGLKLTNLRSNETQVLDNPDSKIQALGQHFLFAAEQGICYVKHLIGKEGYKIYKYNLAGESLFVQSLPHTEEIKKTDLEYSRQYLQYLSHTPWEIIFTAYEKTQNITYLLDLVTGALEEIPFSIKGVILSTPKEGDTQRKHQGFLSTQDNQLQVTFRKAGAKTTQFNLPNIHKYNTLEGLLHGNLLIIAAYNRSQAGAHIYALDLQAQSLVWELPLASIEDNNTYFHKIWLSNYENKLIIEGNQNNGRLLKIIDFGKGSMVFANAQ